MSRLRTSCINFCLVTNAEVWCASVESTSLPSSLPFPLPSLPLPPPLSRQVLDSLDAVIDVGGAYDPSTDRFDHHQKGFTHVFGHGFTTKLSSAGLVYKVRGEGV